MKERLARQAEEANETKGRPQDDEEIEHFELRKEMPSIKSEYSSGESPEKSTGLPPMPRAILLSNPQLLYQQKAPKLYDEEDLGGKTPASSVDETTDAGHLRSSALKMENDETSRESHEQPTDVDDKNSLASQEIFQS